MDFFFPVFREWPWFLFGCPQTHVLACFWPSYSGFSISFLRTTFATFPYMKYVFDALTYRKYVLVRLQGVWASLNRETVSWMQCVFPVLSSQQSFWTFKAENHDLYKKGLLELPQIGVGLRWRRWNQLYLCRYFWVSHFQVFKLQAS